MHKIEIETDELEYVSELIELSELNDDIDLITEKSFNGDLTIIELYISLTFNIIAIVVPIIKTLIKQRKISSLKIDGQKIEINNVSQELIAKILTDKMEMETNEKLEGTLDSNAGQGE